MARRHRGAWQLGYILELGAGPRQHCHLALWVGGAPNPTPKARTNDVDDEGNWSVPDDLARFRRAASLLLDPRRLEQVRVLSPGRRVYSNAFEREDGTQIAVQRQAGLAVINRSLAAKLRA